ncbi:MAG: MgtC/SapB family protein [Clostridia bacterium]|nr:MgtC/SapB family protein [Clostridia bacterium]
MNDFIAGLLGEWSSQIGGASVIFRIAVALIMSAIIGMERSGKRHSAGLRTFILVCLAGTVSIMLDMFIKERTGSGYFVISAATIVGSAIITVNSIFFSARNQIKGLTTSVGLWACGILGMTVGAGFYTVSVFMFAALLMCLSLFPSFERYLKNRSNHFEVHLELKDASYLQNFVTTIRELGLTIDDIEHNTAYEHSGLSVYSIAISISSEELKKYKTHAEIIEALRSLDYIYHIEEMR